MEVCRWPCARFAVRGRSFVEADSWFMNEGRSSCESSMALRSLVFFVCASRCTAFYGKSGAFSDHSPISPRRPHVIVTASASASAHSAASQTATGDAVPSKPFVVVCATGVRPTSALRCRDAAVWVRGCVGALVGVQMRRCNLQPPNWLPMQPRDSVIKLNLTTVRYILDV